MTIWLGFGDHDLIFRVTVGLKLPNLSQKMLVCTISHELVGRFQPDLHGYNIGTWWRADLVLVTLTYFSRSLRDLNCQIWAKKCLCAQYFMNQPQICTDITFGHDKKLNSFWWTCAQYFMNQPQICTDITFGHDKKLNSFWWTWSNFQIFRLNPPNLSQKCLSACYLMLLNLQAFISQTGSIAY